MLEIVDLSQAPPSDKLWGFHIDLPKRGSQIDGYNADIMGWVLGREAPAVGIELLHQGSVLRHLPVSVPRPDILAAFSKVPEADLSGFRGNLLLSGSDLTVSVQAILRNQQRVPLGTFRARRRWREDFFSPGAALVSVIVPVSNQSEALRRSIESVISQTYPHFELIVIDTGSTSDIGTIATSFPGVRHLSQPGQSSAASLNTGLRRSNGTYLVFLRPGELLTAEALQIGLQSLKDHPDCAVSAGRLQVIDGNGVPRPHESPSLPPNPDYAAFLRTGCTPSGAATIYRRGAFETVCSFNPDALYWPVPQLFFDIARNFPVHCHDKITAEVEQENGNGARPEILPLLSAYRSQWKHVKNNRPLRDAYCLGLRSLLSSQDEKFVAEWRRSWAEGPRKPLLLEIASMARSDFSLAFALFRRILFSSPIDEPSSPAPSLVESHHRT